VLAEIRARSCRGLPDIQVAALDAAPLEVSRAHGGRAANGRIGTLGGTRAWRCCGDGRRRRLDTSSCPSGTRRWRAKLPARRRRRPRPRAVGAAADILPQLIAAGPFDLVFIDADKEGYPAYLDWATDNLRPGGIVLLDNAFLFGSLAEAATVTAPRRSERCSPCTRCSLAAAGSGGQCCPRARDWPSAYGSESEEARRVIFSSPLQERVR
jgi:caffeoyl-CoA O-methyltransferase